MEQQKPSFSIHLFPFSAAGESFVFLDNFLLLQMCFPWIIYFVCSDIGLVFCFQVYNTAVLRRMYFELDFDLEPQQEHCHSYIWLEVFERVLLNKQSFQVCLGF